jgi:trehalose-6-phosphate synthase
MMRIAFKIIFPLILIIALVASVFAFWRANGERERLATDLERRSSLIAEVLGDSLSPLLEKQSTDSAARILNKFSNRERMVGAAVYDSNGTFLVASEALKAPLEAEPQTMSSSIQIVERLHEEHGAFVTLDRKRLHTYSVPLPTEENVKYVLTLFHDRTYIEERVNRIWIDGFWRALAQAFLVTLTTLLMIYLGVMAPIKRTTDWIRRVRRGENVGKLVSGDRAVLGPLAQEISKLAKSLEMARLAAEREAKLRQESESLWTPERLKEWVVSKLQDRSIFVVANREPYMHLKKGGQIECIVPASGLVTALEPVLKACGGTWVAQGSGNADREMSDSMGRLRVPPEEPMYQLRRVWLTQQENNGFYLGFSNEGLWPLCHIAHTRPVFRPQDWIQYQKVNQRFADAVVQETEDHVDPCILVQDYHFALLPRYIKDRRPDARVSIFWHIPWPNPESFGICPWRRELLEGMLGADVIGFHTQFHCNNFLETVDRYLESRIDYEHFTVHREGHTTWVKPFPISINFTGDAPNAPVPMPIDRRALLKPYGIEAELLGVGVDRLDYTKGILERFRAIEYFLDQHKEYQGRFTFVELGAPSRGDVPKYAEFLLEVTAEEERINARFKTARWKPILFLKKHHSHKEIQPFYRAADLCMVTSLHDGMNLVAKEYVASRADLRGSLILSQFTGAARDLTDALIINPYDVEQTAEAIHTALEMPEAEQETRMKRLRDGVKDRNIYRWAGDIVSDLAQIRPA